MPGEDRDPEFEALCEGVLTMKRHLPEAAALLAEMDREGYDIEDTALSKFTPLALEAMRQFSRGELTEGEMFFQVVGEMFP